MDAMLTWARLWVSDWQARFIPFDEVVDPSRNIVQLEEDFQLYAPHLLQERGALWWR